MENKEGDMKLFRMIINDIREKKNLDGYITALGAFIIVILGMSGAVNITIVLSAVLAILTFITIWLIQNRHENNEIRLALSKIDYLQSLFQIISENIETSIIYKTVPREEYAVTLKYMQELISKASNEVLILDYNPLARYETDYDNTNIEERKMYHKEFIEKFLKSKKGSFRYCRIIQVPIGKTVADLLRNDPVFYAHCKDVVELANRQPEIIALKSCSILFHGTIIIIDRQILLVSIHINDPDNQFYYDPGYFHIIDPGKKVINQFIKHFNRAETKATLVKSEDLV